MKNLPRVYFRFVSEVIVLILGFVMDNVIKVHANTSIVWRSIFESKLLLRRTRLMVDIGANGRFWRFGDRYRIKNMSMDSLTVWSESPRGFKTSFRTYTLRFRTEVPVWVLPSFCGSLRLRLWCVGLTRRHALARTTRTAFNLKPKLRALVSFGVNFCCFALSSPIYSARFRGSVWNTRFGSKLEGS